MAKVWDISKENATFQRLEALKRSRAKRNEYEEIFVESVACIDSLVAAKWPVHSIAFDRRRPLSAWAQDVIDTTRPKRILRLSSELMEKVSDRAEPSELIVIAQRKVRRLEELKVNDDTLILIFDRPSNPGNLGSLIRSADALGATGVVTTGHSVDLFDPVVLRSSLGAFFLLPVVHCASPREVEAWRKHRPIRLIGTSAEGAVSLPKADLTGPVGIVLGNEAAGMSRRFEEMVDECVAIPMHGHVDSLNVACAGTVVLYEAMRQRIAT